MLGTHARSPAAQLFMLKGYVRDTNCAPPATTPRRRDRAAHAPRGVAVYETVVRKEAERRAAITEPTFADVLKEQWEAKQRELQQSEARRRDERRDATSERKP